jgi:PTS system cellobiose-specific IIC component
MTCAFVEGDVNNMAFEDTKFGQGFIKVAVKLGNQIHLRSLRDAFATIMPLYILAGLSTLLNNTVFTWIFKGTTLLSLPILQCPPCSSRQLLLK